MWPYFAWLYIIAFTLEVLKEPPKIKSEPYKAKRGFRIEDRISKWINDLRQSEKKSG